MKCEECQFLVEGYFDGELDQATGALVATHIESCLPCNSEFEQLALEHQTYSSYERGLSAFPDLWVQVRDRITDQQVKTTTSSVSGPERLKLAFSNLFVPRFSVPVSVAVLLFGIVSTVAVMKYLDRKQPAGPIASVPQPQSPEKTSTRENNGPEVPKGKATEDLPDDLNQAPKPLEQRRAGVSTAARRESTPSQLVRDAEKNYLNAIALLTRDVAKRPSQLDPETRAKLDEALVSIDRTITATRKAVRKDPTDPLVVQYMLTAYAKKVDVLKEMTTY